MGLMNRSGGKFNLYGTSLGVAVHAPGEWEYTATSRLCPTLIIRNAKGCSRMIVMITETAHAIFNNVTFAVNCVICGLTILALHWKKAAQHHFNRIQLENAPREECRIWTTVDNMLKISEPD
jgi:hypothetical protein